MMDIADSVASASRAAKRPRYSRGRKGSSEEGTGSYAQWTQRYAQARFGRLTPKKIDSLSLERSIFTHRRIGPFNDYGQYFLSNRLEANGNLQLPLMLFELNSCNNLIDGSVVNHAPVKRMFQAAAGGINWLDVQGHETDGSTLSAAWQVENSGHTTSSVGTYPGDIAIHKWSSVDLELWGCRNKPTKFTIQLVQFSEDVLPDYNTASGQRQEFWQSLIKHYTYSPLAKMDDGYSRKKMKILKQYKVNIDPTANYENDPDPHVKTMKIFYRFNRKCNFKWMFNNAQPQSITNMNDADWKQEAGQNQTQVHPNARIYLMVRASNFTRLESTATVDNTTNPSISWVMRTCWLSNT